jgi:hypothetical protein
MKGWVLLIYLVAAVPTFVQAGERELGWDSGVWGSCTCREAGAGTWFGNDFNLSGSD